MVTSLALGHSYDCHSAREATQKDTGKCHNTNPQVVIIQSQKHTGHHNHMRAQYEV